MILEARILKSPCWQVGSFQKLQGRLCSLPLPVSSHCWYSLIYGCVTPVSPSVATLLSPPLCASSVCLLQGQLTLDLAQPCFQDGLFMWRSLTQLYVQRPVFSKQDYIHRFHGLAGTALWGLLFIPLHRNSGNTVQQKTNQPTKQKKQNRERKVIRAREPITVFCSL